jgi:GGDEF domain-containing protein
VILTGAGAATDAAVAAERINERLGEHAQRQRRPYPVTVSVGIASASPYFASSLFGLLRAADEAMYTQKRERQTKSVGPSNHATPLPHTDSAGTGRRGAP